MAAVPIEPPPALEPPPIETHILIAEVISEKETRGDCSQKGLSGETGCHQFMPSTWRAYSTEVFGEVLEQTEENAEYVTQEMVRKWLDEGYTEREIFLIWNQGHAGACKRGVNKYGVPYDSCAYADHAQSILEAHRGV